MKRTILPLIAFLALIAPPTKPLLLIVQEKVPDLAEKTESVDVMRPMAEALDAGGKDQCMKRCGSFFAH